jgi:UDP-N-acetylmuramate dehydrogenase
MQNIGAYGVEVQEVIEEVEVWSLDEQKKMRFSKKDCAFGYRESIFKRALKGRVVILSVVFRLFKIPTFRTEYGAIQQELDKMNLEKLTIKAVSDAVIRIRSSKLPDPAVIGNAGSFFKNPTVSAATYHQLKTAFPGLVAYELADGHYKIAAGWLIEQCGWKGYRKGDAGCHAQQALVLVNYGNAKGKEIVELSGAIADSIQRRFGVLLEREVNLFPPID